MFHWLKDPSVLKFRKVIGLHYHSQSTGDTCLTCVILVSRKGKVEIERMLEVTGDWDALVKQLPPKTPIYVSIDGKGVLHKQVIKGSGQSTLHQVIPGASEADFYVEVFPGEDDRDFLSVARRDFIEEVLRQMVGYGLAVIGLSISPFNVTGNASYFPEELPDIYMQPFFNALGYYLSNPCYAKYPATEEQRKEFIGRRLFNTLGAGALMMIFIILAANFFIYTNFIRKKQRLEILIAGSHQELTRLKSLSEELAWKRTFIFHTRINGIRSMAMFADKLASTVPEDIILERLDIHPLMSKIRKSKEIEPAFDRVSIEGISESSIALNEWVGVLEELNEVERVNVDKYSQIESSGYGTFTITLYLAEPD